MEEEREATGGPGRWRRREERRQRERRRIKKHGASLGRVYVSAVRKRLRRGGDAR